MTIPSFGYGVGGVDGCFVGDVVGVNVAIVGDCVGAIDGGVGAKEAGVGADVGRFTPRLLLPVI